MNNALPCPFCASKEIKTFKQKFNDLTDWIFIKCETCTAKIYGLSDEAVLKKWNRRGGVNEAN
jgi:Lar family restriction alleviation protein